MKNEIGMRADITCVEIKNAGNDTLLGYIQREGSCLWVHVICKLKLYDFLLFAKMVEKEIPRLLGKPE